MTTLPSNPLLRPPLSSNGRLLILLVAFLGWMCAGMHMSITQLTGKAAASDLLVREGLENTAGFNVLVARWFAWFQCAFLFGAAAGGLVFGWLGDRIGRAKGMSASILTYSSLAGAAYFAQSSEQLLVLWFLACVGVGGMWPNGVALVSEAWASMSRPMVAGVIGTAANIGIWLFSQIAETWPITADNWRWVMLVGAAPMALGLVSLFAVPESPLWLTARSNLRAVQSPPDRGAEGVPSEGFRKEPTLPDGITVGDEHSLIEGKTARSIARPIPKGEVFRPPLLAITFVGIILATTPLIGGWGTANWMIPWADKAGEQANPPNPSLKATVLKTRSLTGIVGSLLGGWIASSVGRRLTYFLASLASLLIAQYTFWLLVPTDPWFLFWVGALGFVSGIYFGWLPLFLPELFPTRVRSTGAGVSFNFGRILTAITIFATGVMMKLFDGEYARIGRVTSLIFIFGMVAILFAPDTSRKQLED